MKILWLCNTLLPHAAEKLGLPKSKPESWILGAYEQLKEREDVSLVYLFPHKRASVVYEEEKTAFVSYPQKNQNKFEKAQKEALISIFKAYSPDVIHIFGTEYPHSYAAVLAAKETGLLSRTVIHIQGLSSYIARHYFASLPFFARHGYTLRDLLRRENVYRSMLSFRRRGKYEAKALALVPNVIGRTDWDYACTKGYNPSVNYHFCNETLRPSFYEDKVWSYEGCEKHSLFVSQCSYPLKGFHLALDAMREIVKSYPDARLYTTGKSPLVHSFKGKLRQGYYNKYLGKLIRKYGLEKNVVFLGFLSEEQMRDRYLNSNVFVSPSSLENSSNSVGEAMILGVPVISSDVGGIKSLMSHGGEGYLYQADAPYMLAHYVKEVFRMENSVLPLCERARSKALATHNRENNFETLVRIYEEVTKGNANE